MRIDDETLMAYADGELPDAQATDVARAIAKDASIAARYALFTKSKTAVQHAFQDPAPVSADLEARVRAIAAKSATNQNATPAANDVSTPANNVVSLASRRRMVPLWQLPLAAALALAVGVGASRFGTEPQGLQLAGINDPAIITALGTVASGSPIKLGSTAEFTAIATFRDSENSLCREFKHDQVGGPTMVAVACRVDQKWDLKFAIAAAPETSGYAPASSLETLDAYLSASGAGAPLSASDEAAALQLSQ